MLKGLTETCSCNQRVSFVSPLGDLRSTESVPNLTGTSQFSIYVWKPPALTLSILTSVCWPLPWLNCMTLVSLPRTFLSFQSVGGITEFLLNVKTNIFSWFFVPLGSQAVFAVSMNTKEQQQERRHWCLRAPCSWRRTDIPCLQRHRGVTCQSCAACSTRWP